MIRALALALLLATPAQGFTVAEEAAQAARDLQASVAAIEQAEGARDRVAALTTTIRAYEKGLEVLRENLRQAAIRESTLELLLEAKRDEIAQLLGVLMRMDARPGPLLLMHPSGPLGTARSGMILSEVTPALLAQAESLRQQLQEMRELQDLQAAAGKTLSDGLEVAQKARTALSLAISERVDLPKRVTDDPEVLKGLLESADTLEAFADGLGATGSGGAEAQDFESARGRLPWPVVGPILRRANEADAAGIRRPGVLVATPPQALVTAPWPATIRYRGPLLDYGNVMILEPAAGYLLVLAGLGTVYGDTGEVVAAGAPLGLMGGGLAESDLPAPDPQAAGARGTETLYLELRQGAEPVDPAEWFVTNGE